MISFDLSEMFVERRHEFIDNFVAAYNALCPVCLERDAITQVENNTVIGVEKSSLPAGSRSRITKRRGFDRGGALRACR
jgi:hypothetical protein